MDYAKAIVSWPLDLYAYGNAALPMIVGLGAGYYYLGGVPFGANAVPASTGQLVIAYALVGAGVLLVQRYRGEDVLQGGWKKASGPIPTVPGHKAY